MYFKPPQNNGANPFYHPLNKVNEEVKTIDKKKAKDIYDKLKKGSEIEVDFGNAITRGGKPITLKVTSGHRVVGASRVGRIILVDKENPRGMKYKLFDRNGSVSLAQSDMGTVLRDMKIVKEGVEEIDEEKKLDSRGLGVTRQSGLGKKKKTKKVKGKPSPPGEAERMSKRANPNSTYRYEDTEVDESRDDFDYLDIEAAMQDAKLEAPKVVKTRRGYQVMVFSRKLKKHIPQGPPHRSKAAAEKDAKMFEDVQLDEKVMTFTFRKTEDAREFESKAFSLANSTDIMMMPGGKTGVEVSTMGPKDDKRLISLAKKMGGRVHKIVEDVQLDEERGTKIKVMVKGDENVYERMTRALMYARLPGYEGATFNKRKGMTTYAFDAKKHTSAVRKKFAKIIETHNGEFVQSIEEGFASDAQRRAAFASGYKAKGKKKKNEEEEVDEADINLPNKPKNAIRKPKVDSKPTMKEGLRQAMTPPAETSSQKRKRQEKDNFDLYKKRQARIAALRGDRSSRKLTKKQEKDYMMRVNLDQIKALTGKKKK